MFEPQNENGTRDLWAQVMPSLGFRIIESRIGFPDYIVEDITGKRVRVEVEYISSNFVAHKHAEYGCDLIVCWRKDKELPIDVLELRSMTLTHGRGQGWSKRVNHTPNVRMAADILIQMDNAGFARLAASVIPAYKKMSEAELCVKQIIWSALLWHSMLQMMDGDQSRKLPELGTAAELMTAFEVAANERCARSGQM